MNQHIVSAYDVEIKELQSKIITMGRHCGADAVRRARGDRAA